jgi:hypothetical protein
MPLLGAEGKATPVDRAPSPWGISNEGLTPETSKFDGCEVETTDGSFLQLSQASHLFHLTFLGDDNVAGSESPPFGDRPDIDDAMVDALRRAMVHEGGLPDPMRADPHRNDRLDIDSALVDALARAIVGEPEAHDG